MVQENKQIDYSSWIPIWYNHYDNAVVQFSFVQNHAACELNKCKLVEIGAITYM